MLIPAENVLTENGLPSLIRVEPMADHPDGAPVSAYQFIIDVPEALTREAKDFATKQVEAMATLMGMDDETREQLRERIAQVDHDDVGRTSAVGEPFGYCWN